MTEHLPHNPCCTYVGLVIRRSTIHFDVAECGTIRVMTRLYSTCPGCGNGIQSIAVSIVNTCADQGALEAKQAFAVYDAEQALKCD